MRWRRSSATTTRLEVRVRVTVTVTVTVTVNPHPNPNPNPNPNQEEEVEVEILDVRTPAQRATHEINGHGPLTPRGARAASLDDMVGGRIEPRS